MRYTVFLLLIWMTSVTAFAHPGKTDRSGGHRCIKGCEEWGLFYREYHLHDKDGRPIRIKRQKKERIPASAIAGVAASAISATTATSKSEAAAPAAPIPSAPREETLSPSLYLFAVLALLLFLLLHRIRRRRDKT